MLLQRHAVAAMLVATLQPSGAAQGEPLEGASAAHPAAELAAAPVDGYYRIGTAPARSGTTKRGSFGFATVVRPAIEPGTTAWLSRSAAEPLASSYASPHPARREVGISYSSDGRMNAYLAARDRTATPGDPQAESAACCTDDTRQVAPGTYAARRTESQAVASLIGRLKTRGLKLALDDEWKLSAGARSREYSNSALNSRVGHITLQRWWGDVSTAYSVQLEKRGGWNVAPSQSVQLGYAFAPRSTVGVSYTTGQELAFFGAQGMLKTEVRSVALQAEHAVEKNWSLRFDAGYYDHGALPAHRAVRVAFRRSLW